MQKLLDTLNIFCDKWGLKVNMDKTNLVVFRNGVVVRRNEKVYFQGKSIKFVPYFKYFGVLILSRLSSSPFQTNLAKQAQKAMMFISNVTYNCELSYRDCEKMFETCVIPILSYGSELWGLNVHQSIEYVQNRFCRMQLRVGSRSCKVAVLSGCGRTKLYIGCLMKSIKFWLKLISLPDDILAKSCYNMLYSLCTAGRKNWASDIKNVLYRFGYGYVWESQNVLNPELFKVNFKQRLIDCETQMMLADINDTDKLRTYNIFKCAIKTEKYLLCMPARKLKVALARLRIGNHCLEVEKGRHHNVPPHERLCKLCLTQNIEYVENEYHVFFCVHSLQ